MDPFRKKIKASLEEMTRPGEFILLAVSGGPDSIALLRIMNELRESLKIRIAVAHFNHKARGADSDADEAFVVRTAQSLGVELVTDSADIKALLQNSATSFQETARRYRYEFLESSRDRLGATRIATGHNADDQAETLLINLLRGSGLRGLGGLTPLQETLIRPLAACSRADIMGYLNANDIEYMTDASNTDPSYVRNRVRSELLPTLETFNPNIKEVLARTASILRQDERALSALAETTLKKLSQGGEEEGRIVLDLKTFRKEESFLQSRLVWTLLRKLYGGGSRFSESHVDAALRLILKGENGQTVQLPKNKSLVIENANAVFYFESTQNKTANAEGVSMVWSVPGDLDWPAGECSFTSRLLPQPMPRIDPMCEACFDFDKVGSVLIVRCFQNGDVCNPLGMNGHKKLKDIFIDSKIPRNLRRTIPIVTTESGDIIWVYGLRISQGYCVDANTSTLLHLAGSKNYFKR